MLLVPVGLPGKRIQVASIALLMAGFTIVAMANQDMVVDGSRPTWVRCLTFSPDGRFLAAVGAYERRQGELVVWRVDSFIPSWRYSEPVGFARVGFSSNSQHLGLARFAAETKIFEAANGQ